MSFILMANIACANGAREATFRPVTLTVLDAETETPLEWAKVYEVRRIHRDRSVRFFGQLMGESRIEKTYYIDEYYTDELGMVEIPETVVPVERDQYLGEQVIYINFELIEKDRYFERGVADVASRLSIGSISFYPPTEETGLFRPMEEYKAATIYSTPYPLGKGYEQMDNTKPYYTLILDGHDPSHLSDRERKQGPTSFYTDHQEFRILLEPFVDPEL